MTASGGCCQALDGYPRIAQVGPQAPPAPSATLRAKALRCGGGSLLWTTWTIRYRLNR